MGRSGKVKYGIYLIGFRTHSPFLLVGTNPFCELRGAVPRGKFWESHTFFYTHTLPLGDNHDPRIHSNRCRIQILLFAPVELEEDVEPEGLPANFYQEPVVGVLIPRTQVRIGCIQRAGRGVREIHCPSHCPGGRGASRLEHCEQELRSLTSPSLRIGQDLLLRGGTDRGRGRRKRRRRRERRESRRQRLRNGAGALVVAFLRADRTRGLLGDGAGTHSGLNDGLDCGDTIPPIWLTRIRFETLVGRASEKHLPEACSSFHHYTLLFSEALSPWLVRQTWRGAEPLFCSSSPSARHGCGCSSRCRGAPQRG